MGLPFLPPRRWPWAALAAAGAVAVHLWGLYRVTGPPTPPWFTHADKLEHLVGFGLPLLLVLIALDLRARAQGHPLSRLAVGLATGAFVLHAVVSEVVQGAFYTTRSGDPTDAVADLIGVLLGLLTFLGLQRRIARTRPREVAAGQPATPERAA